MDRILRICKKITDTKSVRPELVEGQPFMVRQTHHERVTVPLILLQPLSIVCAVLFMTIAAGHGVAADNIRPVREKLGKYDTYLFYVLCSMFKV